ncbi:uncharacterized protein EAE98_000510 [Botrytis deweyae]|uniref:Uncharacterized protein n=1 Tax=Botrytis deweyae TaxID=2478750 RepID=A0ABQ7J3U2_9HELO|nr:uncharacterized protein EAE98_000510 [Botrytis deweyae]KAF7933415.1 hypothetical protein EAE99_003300 [Botrytis elliptica]KAF7940383.1 hypothetical protein EAE98_000510 [Botrytis deweyae]
MPILKIKMPHPTASTSNSPPSAAPTPAHYTSTPTPAQGTSPPSHTHKSSTSRSASPERPPVSPITPTLSAARLASTSNVNANVNLGVAARNGTAGLESQSSGYAQRSHVGGKNIAIMNNTIAAQNSSLQPVPTHPAVQAQAHALRETYTHIQQAPQVSMPQPKPSPQTIDLSQNPDALAVKSAISILQLQMRNAKRDMVTLQRIKERAMEDPEGFIGSLQEGEQREREEIARKRGRMVVDTESSSDEDEDEDEDSEEAQQINGAQAQNPKWETLPTPQNIVRCPPVNWAKYGVMGESLDKLHADQIRTPSQGIPATINADWSTTHKYGDGKKEEYAMQKPLEINEVEPKLKKKRSPASKKD